MPSWNTPMKKPTFSRRSLRGSYASWLKNSRFIQRIGALVQHNCCSTCIIGVNPQNGMLSLDIRISDAMLIQVMFRLIQAFHHQRHAAQALAKLLQVFAERARLRQVFHTYLSIVLDGKRYWHCQFKTLPAFTQWERNEHSIPVIGLACKRSARF